MIQAIETSYNGYRFRSRLEARWAVFFDALSIEWLYEHEGYTLPDGTRYLPDFWLPQLDLWFEVKGTFPDKKEQDKVIQLSAANAANPVFLAYGEVDLTKTLCWFAG